MYYILMQLIVKWPWTLLIPLTTLLVGMCQISRRILKCKDNQANTDFKNPVIKWNEHVREKGPSRDWLASEGARFPFLRAIYPSLLLNLKQTLLHRSYPGIVTWSKVICVPRRSVSHAGLASSWIFFLGVLSYLSRRIRTLKSCSSLLIMRTLIDAYFRDHQWPYRTRIE
jgi:hypothetical protein